MSLFVLPFRNKGSVLFNFRLYSNLLSSKNNFRKGEVAKKICELTNAHLISENYNMDTDFRDYEVSYSKIKKLGFISELDFDESLKSLKKYYEVN